MVQLHPLAHAQFVGKAHHSETKFEKGASDRNSRTGCMVGMVVDDSVHKSTSRVVAFIVLKVGTSWGIAVEHEFEVMVLNLRGLAITVELIATTEVVLVVHDLGPEVFWYLLRRPGRQLSQSLPSFPHEQFLQLRLLLQQQHGIFKLWI